MVIYFEAFYSLRLLCPGGLSAGRVNGNLPSGVLDLTLGGPNRRGIEIWIIGIIGIIGIMLPSPKPQAAVGGQRLR